MKAIRRLFLALALAMLAQVNCLALEIERIEPPNWWVGMKDQRLQLLVHGPGIAALTPALNYPGVKLQRASQVDNPNYLFLDLQISKAAKPGEMVLRLNAAGKTVLTRNYPLLARAPGSAQRQGFGPKDAIYLIVPDRFANGDSANDNQAGMGDGMLRSNVNGRHGGDLAGMAGHLDYIEAMGFTQIWSTPLLENRQRQYSYHGYSPTDLYRIDPRFGSNEEYRRFVAMARAKGIGVIQDIVLNHIGSGHWWMTDLPAQDWINGQGDPYLETNHRHTTQHDPYVAPGDLKRFTDGWFVPTMPDLNQRNHKLATYLVQNAIWWIEYAGLSGLRVDTYPYSDKAFLAIWSKALLDEYPRLNMVGEEMNNNPALVAYWLRGKRNHDGYVSHLPAMMDFPLHGALRDALTEPEGQGFGVGLGRLYDAMINDVQYPDPAKLLLFEGNHDTNRIFSALGEDPALNRMAMAFIATTKRTPQIFYGSEILMTSPLQREDGQVRADFPGGWPGDGVNAFTGQGLSTTQREAQDYLRRLLNWRKTATVVHQGRLMHYDPLNGCYVYFRYTEKEKLMVVLNKNQTPMSLDTRRFAEMLRPQSVGVDVLSGERHSLATQLSVPARTALILAID